MSAMASQIPILTIVYSIVYSGTDQRKHQSSASLSFVWGIHRWLVNSPHKGPVMRKMFPFDEVIMHQLVMLASKRFTLHVLCKKSMTIFSLNMNDNFDIMIETLHILNKGNKLIDAKHDIVYCLHKKILLRGLSFHMDLCHCAKQYKQMHGITHIIFHVCG